jgi:hypothetical protein
MIINYERVIDNSTSFLVYFGFPSSNIIYGEQAKSDYRSFSTDEVINYYIIDGNWSFKHSIDISPSIAIELRHYFDKILRNPKDLYFGGGFNYFNMKDKVSFTTIDSYSAPISVVNNNDNLFTLYLSLGVQFIPVNYLTLDFNIKPSYCFGNGTDILNKNITLNGFRFNYCIGLGINY